MYCIVGLHALTRLHVAPFIHCLKHDTTSSFALYGYRGIASDGNRLSNTWPGGRHSVVAVCVA